MYPGLFALRRFISACFHFLCIYTKLDHKLIKLPKEK